MEQEIIFSVLTKEENLTDGELEAGIQGPGWYFWDETWSNAHGPFNTRIECEQTLKNYINNKIIYDINATNNDIINKKNT